MLNIIFEFISYGLTDFLSAAPPFNTSLLLFHQYCASCCLFSYIILAVDVSAADPYIIFSTETFSTAAVSVTFSVWTFLILGLHIQLMLKVYLV